jgi:outer membrane receptor for ferrienterochelin and colicins
MGHRDRTPVRPADQRHRRHHSDRSDRPVAGQSRQRHGLCVEWTSTFNFDPIGWGGAKLDLNLQFQTSSLEDPLTGLDRPINENLTREVEVNFRRDIPQTDWAYGASFYQFRQSPLFRLDERWKFLDTLGRLGLFVEHKNVMGLTMRAGVDNLLGTNESFNRVFFDGRRTGPVRLTEDRDRFYGPVFTLTISGTI